MCCDNSEDSKGVKLVCGHFTNFIFGAKTCNRSYTSLHTSIKARLYLISAFCNDFRWYQDAYVTASHYIFDITDFLYYRSYFLFNFETPISYGLDEESCIKTTQKLLLIPGTPLS
jgi:hypothetical protein